MGALLSLLYLTQTSDVATTGYDIADLQTQEQSLQMQNEQLKLQIARLESLDRVGMEAATRLRMGPPKRQLYVTAPAIAIPTPLPVATPSDTPADSPFSELWNATVKLTAPLINPDPSVPTPPPNAGSGA